MSEKEIVNQIGSNIKRFRTFQRIKQVELAEMCGFKKSNLNRIEAGKTNPTIKTLFRISRALNIGIFDLLKV
jgi:transcriptional regulator with XRE-family HTH domain